MQLTSPAFAHGAAIPARFTCDGQNTSPEFSWQDAPEQTKSFALVLHDPDAPKPGGFTHWIVYNIPNSVVRVEENASPRGGIGIGQQGKNDAGKIGYMGPCPPSGTHRYFARLYALSSNLDLEAGASYSEILRAMEGKIITQAELMGTYARVERKSA